MMPSLQPRFEQSAKHYTDVAIQQREVCVALWRMVAPHISANDLLLDVGCGDGALAGISHHSHLIGIDLAHAMCRVAVNDMPSAQSDMHDLPLTHESVDGWFSSLALQWSTAPEKAMNEAVRVTKRGGVIACATYLDGTLSQLHQAMRAIDYPVRPFASLVDMQRMFEREDLTYLDHQVMVETECFDDVMALLKHMKSIGANRYYPADQPVMSRAQLKQLGDHYPKTATSIEAEWHIGLWVFKVGA
ncbi:MAG: methyltransferase domain-containing protein [Rickettsiales bacterium]|nr:methyltransferase domain-containing protein [Rickettsiales bacterium]